MSARIQEPPPADGVYCNATWDHLLCWDYTPTLTVASQKCPYDVRGLRGGAIATRRCESDGSWFRHSIYNASGGWTNYSACLDIAPSQPDHRDHVVRIQLMSNIGYAISLVALVFALVIMLVSKRLRSKSNILHMNLFLAFILRATVHFLNLLLVDQPYLELESDLDTKVTSSANPQEPTWDCKLVTALAVYTLSASMTWILVEGLYLQILIYKTLFTSRHGTRMYVCLGWLLPLLIFIPWILIKVYVKDSPNTQSLFDRCWVTRNDSPYMWIVRGPIAFTVLINFIFFTNTLRVLCTSENIGRHVTSNKHQLRKTAKFVLVLIPLFGVVYIVFSAVPPNISSDLSIVHLYGEMFYNSFQGLLLALLFCFLNEEVHTEVRRFWFRRRFLGSRTSTMVLSSLRKHSERTSRPDTHQTALPHGFDRRSGTHTQHTSLSHCDTQAPGSNGSTRTSGRTHFKNSLSNWSDQHDESAERLVSPRSGL
ncbi:hypothetical protein DPMN_193034 [Dreissena polymorpha]|uniref:Uncharacterized protein n=1 Tax=Dreissena polymorpha TaxID=45954 RepID=A0A9D3Y0R1_DREPO|nr:hypothetical protein DPMN_193034 [Dreissena polymorpha]